MSNSAKNGAAFEDAILTQAANNGIYLHRNSPPFVLTAKGWKPVPPGGPPDFTACVGGRSVLFDAKSIEGGTWPVSLIAGHQAVALDRHLAAGGVSAIFLRLRSQSDPVDRWLPWAVVGPVFWRWWDDPKSSAGTFGVGDGVLVVGCDWTQAIGLEVV